MTNGEARKRLQESINRLDAKLTAIEAPRCILNGCPRIANTDGVCSRCKGTTEDSGPWIELDTWRVDKVDDGDPVNHPNHYTALGATCRDCGHDIECIDITRHMGFLAGNAIKYLWRADHKGNRKQDLMKARAYIDRMLEDC